MTVLAIVLAAVLCAVAGAIAAGFIARGAIDWYHIRGPDSGAEYLVPVVGLGGLIAGAVIGGIVAAVIGADSAAHVARAVGSAFAATLTLAGIGAAITRGLADIPPKIDGQDLFLVVEVRCPAGQTISPAAEPGDAYLLLGSLAPFKRVVRKSERGPLWKEEAKLIDGRWIVRGAVEVFTSRGRRLLQVAMGTNLNQGFIVPLPRHPRRRHMQWSDWLPRFRTPTPPADALTYRFRVQRWSEPLRTETVGPFEIDTITRGFHHAARDGRNRLESYDTFRVRCRGQKVAIPNEIAGRKTWHERFLSVATLDGDSPALLVNADMTAEGDATKNAFHLITQTPAGDAKIEYIADTGGSSEPLVAVREFVPPPPMPDTFHITPGRRGLSPDGIYRIGMTTVFDTRDRRAYRFTMAQEIYDPNSVTLGASPDRRSLLRWGLIDGKEVALAVTDFVADRTDVLHIDRGRMHFSRREHLTPAWVDHHFAWQRDGDGTDRLVPRSDFTPLPFKGDLKLDYAKRWCYRLDCVGKEMRAAIEDVLVTKLGAQRQPTDSPSDYEHEFRLDGQRVTACCAEEFHYVIVQMDPAIGAERARAIAEKLDAELATGTYDALFLPVFPMD